MEEKFIKEVDILTNGISEYIDNAKYDVIRYANQKLLERNWNIEKYIVENLQGGEKRAKYGTKVLEEVSKRLTEKYGKGFSTYNLRRYRTFYEMFPIWGACPPNSNWTLIDTVLSIKDRNCMLFYLNNSINNNWTSRDLERMIKSKLYERTKIFDKD